ncbi:MAG: PAS domain S-box protein [Alphaproteobacteria bacterium]|nr:PAS domain S-box protein [Alphaproteobacteria bacterium]
MHIPFPSSHQAYLSYIVESSSEAIIATAPDGTITSWNKSAEKLYGYTFEEAFGQSIFFLIPQDIKQIELEYVNNKLSKGEPIIDYETDRIRKDGARITVLLTLSSILNDEGQNLGLAGISRDLTEKKRLDLLLAQKIKELEKANKDFEDFYNNAPDMFLTLDTPTRRILHCNKTLTKYLGYTIEELLTMEVFDLYHPDALGQADAVREEFMRIGLIENAELQLKTKEGKKLHITASATATRDKDGNIIESLLTWRDITALVEAREIALNREAALTTITHSHQKLNTTLVRTSRDLESFIYAASHDLRSPLRTIHSFSQLIGHEPGEILHKDSKFMLEQIQHRTQRMQAFINDMLEYYQAGKINTAPLALNVTNLLIEVIDMLDISGTIKFEYDPATLPTLITPKPPLYQVFHNLLSNAIKHHHRLEEAIITISCKQLESMVEFTVWDNGPGIKKKYHKAIFQPFQRLKPKDEIEGNGLGLALVKKLVEQRGGSISIDCCSGQGTKFIFTWPKFEKTVS